MNDLDDTRAPTGPPAARPRESATHFFGIRHHGPGCARSLLRAFDELRPDCVLVEGPPEADALLAFVRDEAMVPPVALLGYCPDEPKLAVYHPFAAFSPEWQALRWAAAHGAPARFIDLPLTHELAFEKARRDAREAEAQAAAPVSAEAEADRVGEPDSAAARAEPAADPFEHRDPLTWLAHAAGYDDGESGPLDGAQSGRYLDQFERREGLWRIRRRTLVWESNFVRPGLPEIWRGNLPRHLPKRDADDMLYRIRRELGIAPDFGGEAG